MAANLPASTLLGIIIIFLLVISFFVSGAEVAFFSLTYKDINTLKTKQDSSWKRIVNLLEEPKILLASLLIANTFVNIAIIILSNFLIEKLLVDETSYWLFKFVIKVIIVTVFLVLFGEVLPKVWASQNNFRFAYNSSFIVEIIHYLFKRVSIWLVGMSDQVERFLGKRVTAYSLEELDHAIDLSTNNDASEDEKNILKGIVNFGNISVKQVMRTRLDVHGIDFNITFDVLIKQIEELHYSRLPVYKGSLDDIMGIIQTKDLIPHLAEPADFNWHNLLRPPYFVHEQKLIEDLLTEFQSRRIHFAVVVDEFGGTSGIVTLEDILEEIIGEIKDEFDDEESANKKIDETSYVFEGRTMINDVCKMLGLSVDTFDKVRGDSDSLGGMLLELAGDFPKPNDVIISGDFEFTVLEVARNRIQKIKIEIKPIVNVKK
ncbi:MAG: gliding motility-associated protein GldE [Chitinophagaceae bacterium]